MVTKGNVAILHPRCHPNGLVRCEPGDFIAGEQIPHDRCLPGIITHDQTARASFADIVHRQKQDPFLMPLEPAFNGQRVVVQADDRRVLRIEKDGRCGRAGLEFKLQVARIYRCGRSNGRSGAR